MSKLFDRPVLVTGGRDYRDVAAVYRALDPLKPTVVIHGDAGGADAIADQWARLHGVQPIALPALWEWFKKSAGPIRNTNLVELAVKLGAVVVAFPGNSGTADCVRKAREAGLTVHVVEVA